MRIRLRVRVRGRVKVGAHPDLLEPALGLNKLNLGLHELHTGHVLRRSGPDGSGSGSGYSVLDQQV